MAANYRSVCRARSKPDFVSKIGVVVEETDETVFWLELLAEAKIVKKDQLDLLMKEANELLACLPTGRQSSPLPKSPPAATRDAIMQ